MTSYGVDTNVFIEAKNRYYRFDMPPGRWFWNLMDRAVGAGCLKSAEKMREELTPAKDELANWALSHSPDLWIPPDARVLAEVKKLVTWAQARVTGGPTALRQSAVDEFAAGDIFLVATAAAYGLTVVTHEQPAPASRRRILIPDACASAAVPCVDPWTMLQDLNARLGE
jgi:hypothetical protein